MPRKPKAPNHAPIERSEVQSAIHDMEPELRQFEGMLTLLMILGEAQDSIEPLALAALARSGREAFDVLEASWRTVFEGVG